MLELSAAELTELIASPFADDVVAGDDAVHMVIVRDQPSAVPSPGALPVVVCAIVDDHDGAGGWGADVRSGADVMVGEDDLADLVSTIEGAPIAATSLAVLMRSIPSLDVDPALAAESAVYSVLQGGPEFAAWRAAHPPVPDGSDEPTVLVERGDELVVTLHRPQRHNAISRRMRDELCAALAIAVTDPSIPRVVLRGAGPSFCSGGDLDEFGSRPDPAVAHRTRLSRSPARLVHRLAARTHVHVHGAALGGGIELAAFAGQISAHPETVIGLPEVGFGLIPGAGGTVSLPLRIGRHRTSWLALTGRRIDARTALAWGLVDELRP